MVIPPQPTGEAWDRRDDEKDDAWFAFSQYKHMDRPRSIKKLAAQLDMSHGTLVNWSAHWSWTARVREWDTIFDAIDDAEALDTRRRLRRNQARAAQDMATGSNIALTAAIRTLRDYARDDGKRLPPSVALQALSVAVQAAKASQSLLDEPASRIELSGHVDVSGLGVGFTAYELAEALLRLGPPKADQGEVIDVEQVPDEEVIAEAVEGL